VSRTLVTLQITKKKSAAVLASRSIKTMLAPASNSMLNSGGGGGSKAPLNRRTTTRRSPCTAASTSARRQHDSNPVWLKCEPRKVDAGAALPSSLRRCR
jgi:hypothetical protein